MSLSDYIFIAKILENPTINKEAILVPVVKQFIKDLKEKFCNRPNYCKQCYDFNMKCEFCKKVEELAGPKLTSEDDGK